MNTTCPSPWNGKNLQSCSYLVACAPTARQRRSLPARCPGHTLVGVDFVASLFLPVWHCDRGKHLHFGCVPSPPSPQVLMAVGAGFLHL